jgi:hypothetical protein
MSSLMEYLGKDTLPHKIESAFVEWCIWQQARPALTQVLNKANLPQIANEVALTRDLNALIALSGKASQAAKESTKKTGVLALSAAEAVLYEVSGLAKAASEKDWEPELVAFFSARLCGWAGWASTDFSEPARKVQAEKEARDQQEAQLQILWRQASVEQR